MVSPRRGRLWVAEPQLLIPGTISSTGVTLLRVNGLLFIPFLSDAAALSLGSPMDSRLRGNDEFGVVSLTFLPMTD